MKPNASIIIIAYNDEAHVEKAIQSACSQTLRDIEIICVDDGSQDQTLRIMREAAEEDSRIKVETQPNGGTFSARYHGIQMAMGQYIMFLDSDDTLEPEAAEILYKEAEEKHLDVVEFGVHIVEDEKNPPAKETVDVLSDYFSDVRPRIIGSTRGELINACFEKKIISWNVWNKIFQAGKLKEAVQFYNGEYINMSEDMLITLMVLAVTSRYGRIDAKLYHYSIGGGMSTTNQKIGSSGRAKTFGMLPLLLRLQKEWYGKLPNLPADCQAGITAFRRRIKDLVLLSLFSNCQPSYRCEMFEWIGKCVSQEEFCDTLTEFLFVKKHFPAEEGIAALRGSWVTKPAVKEIKTVGMYYYRLYNGGIERVMSLLSAVLRRAGYRVGIITEQGRNDLDYPLPEDVWHVRLGSDFSSPMDRAARWKAVIKEENIDAVIYHSWLDPNLPLDSLAIKSTGASLLVHTHLSADSAFKIPDHRWARQDRVYALADGIVTLSDIDRAWWKALGYRCTRVPNPCTFDIEKIKPASLEGQDVLWVGRLDAVKQYEEAFAIAAIVHRELPDFRLHVLGKAETQEETERIMNSLREQEMDSYIIYEGYSLNVAPYYERASVFLSTSSMEGFPMTFLESKAHGIPVVAYDLPYVDLVRHPKGVLVVDQKDRMNAAKHIIALLKDQGYRKAVGQEARRSVEECYQVPLEQVWKGILNDSLRASELETDSERKNLSVALSRAFDALEVGKEKQPVILVKKVSTPSIHTKAAIQELQNISQMRSIQFTRFLRRTLKQGFNRDKEERKAYRSWLWAKMRFQEDETKQDDRYNPLYHVIGLLEQDVNAKER